MKESIITLSFVLLFFSFVAVIISAVAYFKLDDPQLANEVALMGIVFLLISFVLSLINVYKNMNQ